MGQVRAEKRKEADWVSAEEKRHIEELGTQGTEIGGVVTADKILGQTEENEIRDLYRTGQYSYQQLAEKYFVSKGTIINAVKRYPYNPTEKLSRSNKLQEYSAAELKVQITKAEQEAKRAHERQNYTAYGAHIQRWLMLTQTLAKPDQLYDTIKDARTQYEQQAWQAFADGNYSVFGFYADTWDTLTDILGDNAKNPWRVISAKINARGHSHSVKYSKIVRNGQNDAFSHMCINSFAELSDDSWRLIGPIFNPKTTGRHAQDRRTINGILYALANCRSFRTIPMTYGSWRNLYQRFSEWYKAGYFSDLLQLADACPEVDAVRRELLAIEMHSLAHGSAIVPRLCDIKRAVEKGEAGCKT